MTNAFATSLVVAFLAGTQLSHADTPLPPDVAVIVPGPETPKDAAAFSGKWIGRWDDTLDHTLVVEKVEGRDVTAIYSTGIAQRWLITSPSFARVSGKIRDDGSLRLSLSNGAQVTYRFSGNPSELQGEYARGRIVRGTFVRQ